MAKFLLYIKKCVSNNKKQYIDMDKKEEKENLKNEEVQEETVDTAAEAAGAETTEETAEEPTLEKQLEEANAKIAELTDKILRLHAEFDNYKKRNIKEKAELIKNGGERVLDSFLPVADDMERALVAIEKAEEINAVAEGVKLIHEKLMQTFTKNGVSVIQTKDAVFDTDVHEAVALIPAPSEDVKGKVVDCIQTGYMLNDKVLRHAKVVVAQ